MRQNTSEQNMLNGSEIWFGIEKNEGNIMDIKKEYERWLANATADADVAAELKTLDDAKIEDAFYRDLAFGTGGLRGVIGAGTNRMNIYTVAKASQGLADYLKKNYAEPSVAIGYDSRIKSDVPYVATMLPVVQGIAGLMNGGAGFPPELFYFGLLTGATLGGNLTPIGASANIAAIGILRKQGEQVRTRDFLRIGIPFTLAAVLTGYVYLWLVWGA